MFCVLWGGGCVLAEPISVLIVDGRNNHDWVETTEALRATLLQTGRFDVSVSTSPEKKTINGIRRPREESSAVQSRYRQLLQEVTELSVSAEEAFADSWSSWNPGFAEHDVVVLNYNGPEWPAAVKTSLESFVKAGGGLVLVHAANNGFAQWDAFNEMIGLGWRKGGFGDCIKWENETGKPFVACADCNSGHGGKHPFQVTVQQSDHPIMQGLPPVWMHGTDELYHNMRGSSKNLTILSTAYSDPKTRGTGEHEPVTWEVAYGQGRVIVTTMGHFWPQQDWWDSLYCVGFQTVFARSVEYAATGAVSLPVPDRFPSHDNVSVQAPFEVAWTGQANSAKPPVLEKSGDPYRPLNPEEELATFDLAPGYIAELVASEPQVEEPVLTVWDGNGAMYVAEMRSYMQDEHGTGTKELRNGRIKRLEDTNGDGKMDRVTVFVDHLNLPRMILPLDDRIAVRESDTMDVFAYRDLDGDGVADEKTALFEYGPRGRNSPEKSVEHQDSGLIWNLDNWIYITYNMERYRYTDGEWFPQAQPGHWTQWGLSFDDLGRLFWMDNSHPLKSVQIHPKYWNTVRRLAGGGISGEPITLGNPYTPDFMRVRSLCLLNDRGGPAAEYRAFTSACGQTVFRGDKLPEDSRGAYFFADPTIHVVRRSIIESHDGKIMLRKAEPGDAEFLRSSDINCRFVNTATGPDGTLYVTDMYRGIIQDAPWMNPEARRFTRDSGLAANNNRGRIWRIRHQDFQAEAAPRMLDESTAELVRHLQHPNGWWRDTAQRLIILRDDRETVIPALETLFRYTQNRKARLHALWTLEGMGAVSSELLQAAFTDRESILRRAGVQIAEANLEAHLDKLSDLAGDRDARVAEQLIYSLGTIDDERAETMIQVAARRHLDDRGVMMATAVSLWGKKQLPFVKAVFDGSAFERIEEDTRGMIAADWVAGLGNWDRGLSFPKDMDSTHQRLIRGGETLYFQHCIACHGSDGRGLTIPGTTVSPAPSLADSKRVGGDLNHLIPIFVNGLTGPVEGKTYAAGYMPPMKVLGIERDDRIAELLSFIRYAWGRNGSFVDKETVKAIRQKYEHRDSPWTEVELDALQD